MKCATLLAFIVIAGCAPLDLYDYATDSDAFPEPTSSGAPVDGCMMPGGMFGPCIDNACSLGLACFTAKDGDVCIPVQHGAIDVTDPEIDACAHDLGGSMHCLEELGACAVECEGECAHGAVCDDWTDLCVWPD